MNSPLEGNGVRSEGEASALIQQVKFSGAVPSVGVALLAGSIVSGRLWKC